MAKFRKSIKVAPGIKLNLSKSGVSGTFGGKGASVNIGKDGAYLNTGIPGTGIYDRKKIGGGPADEAGAEGFAADTGETGPDVPPPKTGPLGMLGGFFALGGLAAFILLLFFPGWPRRLVAAAVFVLGIVLARIDGKREKAAALAAPDEAGASAP